MTPLFIPSPNTPGVDIIKESLSIMNFCPYFQSVIKVFSISFFSLLMLQVNPVCAPECIRF